MQTLSTFQTIFVGVLVFVLGQILLKWIIEPIQQLKKTMADVSHTFVCYAYALHNADAIDKELYTQVFDKLRHLSGQLYADMALIPMYCVCQKVFFLPSRSNVYESAQHLIAVANWMGANTDNRFVHIVRNIQTACDKLGLYISPNDRISEEHLKP